MRNGPSAIRSLERIPTEVFDRPQDAARTVAAEIAALIRRRAEEGRLRLEKFRAMSTLEDEIHFLQEFVKSDPTNVEKRCTLAQLQLRAGRTKEALSELETARNLAPAAPAVYRLMAEAFSHLGRDADAAQARAFAASLEEHRQ